MNKFLKITFLISLFVLNMNCKTQQTSGSTPFNTIVYSQYGPEMEATEQIITNAKDFKSYYHLAYENRTPIPGIPKINFDERLVIFLHFGTFNHGGILFEVQEITQRNKELDIVLTQNSPKAGEPSLTVMTHPFMFIDVSRGKDLPNSINIIKK